MFGANLRMRRIIFASAAFYSATQHGYLRCSEEPDCKASSRQALLSPDVNLSTKAAQSVGFAAAGAHPQVASCILGVVQVLGSKEDGCGACISQDGHIVTSLSLLRDNGPLMIRCADGKLYASSVAAVHPAHDVALLQAQPHPTVAPQRWFRRTMGLPEAPGREGGPASSWWQLRSAAAFNSAFSAAEAANPALRALGAATHAAMHGIHVFRCAVGLGDAGLRPELRAMQLARDGAAVGCGVTLASLAAPSAQSGAWEYALLPVLSPAVVAQVATAGTVQGTPPATAHAAWGSATARSSVLPAWTQDMNPSTIVYVLRSCVPSCPAGTPVLTWQGGLLGLASRGVDGCVVVASLPADLHAPSAEASPRACHMQATDTGERFAAFLRRGQLQAATGGVGDAQRSPPRAEADAAAITDPVILQSLALRRRGGAEGFVARNMPLPLAQWASPGQRAALQGTRRATATHLSPTERFIWEAQVWPVLDAGGPRELLGGVLACAGDATGGPLPDLTSTSAVTIVRPGVQQCDSVDLLQLARRVTERRSREGAAQLLQQWSLCTGGSTHTVPGQ